MVSLPRAVMRILVIFAAVCVLYAVRRRIGGYDHGISTARFSRPSVTPSAEWTEKNATKRSEFQHCACIDPLNGKSFRSAPTIRKYISHFAQVC